MTGSTISLLDLDERVALAGHEVWDENSKPDVHRIDPPLDAHITIGANLDPTLKLFARRFYYRCLLWSREYPIPAIRDDPEFLMPATFRDAEAHCPSKGEFAPGPFRWLLRRLMRFDRVLLWPASGGSSGPSKGFDQPHLLDDIPQMKRRLPTSPEDLAAMGAVVLDLSVKDDCQVLWEVALSVSTSYHDWFVSDSVCLEVYKMHHHDKVIVAIPDESRRQDLLDDLDGLGHLIEDCSDYVLNGDDEEE